MVTNFRKEPFTVGLTTMPSGESQDGEGMVQGIPTATQRSKVELNEKQITDYQHHRKRMLRWCLNLTGRMSYAEERTPYSLASIISVDSTTPPSS